MVDLYKQKNKSFSFQQRSFYFTKHNFMLKQTILLFLIILIASCNGTVQQEEQTSDKTKVKVKEKAFVKVEMEKDTISIGDNFTAQIHLKGYDKNFEPDFKVNSYSLVSENGIAHYMTGVNSPGEKNFGGKVYYTDLNGQKDSLTWQGKFIVIE